eukprot:scaffold571_cov364-Prasinococcus_capsulatus_cf.AAC.13
MDTAQKPHMSDSTSGCQMKFPAFSGGIAAAASKLVRGIPSTNRMMRTSLLTKNTSGIRAFPGKSGCSQGGGRRCGLASAMLAPSTMKSASFGTSLPHSCARRRKSSSGLSLYK